MKYKIIVALFLSITSAFSYCQEISTIGTYIYNNSWTLKKGDTIVIGHPLKGDEFEFISSSATGRKGKGLKSELEGQAVQIKDIKRYIWGSEIEDVFFLVDIDNKIYYINILMAIDKDEITLPEGISKQDLSTPSAENNKKQYTASNGVTYKIGDMIELGRGSGLNGKFTYIRIGGWGAAIGSSDPIGSSYAGQKVKLKSILYENNKRRGYTKVWMQVGGGNITNYTLEIEQAIQACEVVPCKDNNAPNNVSVADELIKLKKLKDDGVINEEEFTQQKKKLLSK